MKISIIIPTYNRASYLDGAIKSVLNQKNANFELIISDNCSQDNTKELVGEYLRDRRVKYFRNDENIGMVRNWRRAIFDRSIGDWFILLSDDDYLIDENYLSNVINFINDNKSVVMIYAGGYILDESSGVKTKLNLPFNGLVDGVDVFVSRGSVFPQDFTLCNVVFNRNMAINLNAFSNFDNISCDSELFLKSALSGDVGVFNEPVSVYRFHSGNLLKTLWKSPKLIIGNIDFILSPYLMAVNKITSVQMSEFKKNSNIERFIIDSLLALAYRDWEGYVSCRNYILREAPELLIDTIDSRLIRLKLIYHRFFGWSYPFVCFFRKSIGNKF